MRKNRLVPISLALALVIAGVIVACNDKNPTSPADAATWVADLASTNETQPLTGNTAAATGRAFFTDNGSTITYRIEYQGLSSNSILGHVHFGAAGSAGSVMHTFQNIPAVSNGVIAGNINMTVADVDEAAARTVSPDSLRSLFNKSATYVNIHTTNNTGGEIRGQIRPR